MITFLGEMKSKGRMIASQKQQIEAKERWPLSNLWGNDNQTLSFRNLELCELTYRGY